MQSRARRSGQASDGSTDEQERHRLQNQALQTGPDRGENLQAEAKAVVIAWRPTSLTAA